MEFVLNTVLILCTAMLLYVLYIGIIAFTKMQKDFRLVKNAITNKDKCVIIKDVRIYLEVDGKITIDNVLYEHCGPDVNEIHKDIVHTATMYRNAKNIRYFKKCKV